jgi:hypothetical protein
MEDGVMRYDRGYGMGMRYGADYQDHWSRLRARPAGMYDREYGHGRYDRSFRGGHGAREGYGGDYRAGPRGPWLRGGGYLPWGGWSGAYSPRTGLSERQRWYSPWNDPVPGGGMGMGLGYGMRMGEFL